MSKMRVQTLGLIGILCAAAAAAPVASAFPGLIFDPTCPEREDYVLIDYVLRPYVSFCANMEADPGPSATYPHPQAGIGFAPACIGSVCVGAVCPPVGACLAGPPRPYVHTTDESLTVPIPTRIHGFVEARAACGHAAPCRVDFDVPIPATPVLA